jgi:hypothetical protein
MKLSSKLGIMIILLCLFSLSYSFKLQTQNNSSSTSTGPRYQLSDRKSRCNVRFDYVDNSSNTFRIAGFCGRSSFNGMDLNDCIGFNKGMFIRTRGFKDYCNVCSVNKEDNFALKCWCKKGTSRWSTVKVNVLTMFAWNTDKNRVECY